MKAAVITVSDGVSEGTRKDESGDLLGSSEIGLVDDTRLAVDPSALDDVIVELVGLFLGDDRRHIG